MWFFVSDLHGHLSRYERLFERIRVELPEVVLMGGDLLPGRFVDAPTEDFVRDFLAPRFESLRRDFGPRAPHVALILGNDDPRREEPAFAACAASGLWDYINEGHTEVGGYLIYGYSFVPPSPFMLKDWKRYDVSRYVDTGSASPGPRPSSTASPSACVPTSEATSGTSRPRST